MNTYCFALIFYQILSTHSLRKYIKISLENLYVDIMGLKGLITTITKVLQQTRKNTKTFLNLMQCIQPNSLFLWTGKVWVLKHFCTLWQETKLNHTISVKTDTLNCNLCPGFIQCERTSFLPLSQAQPGKENIICICIPPKKQANELHLWSRKFYLYIKLYIRTLIENCVICCSSFFDCFPLIY